MKKVTATLFFLLSIGSISLFASGTKDAEQEAKDGAMMAPKSDAMAPKDAMKSDAMAPKDAMKSDAMAPKDAMMADPSKAVFDLTGLGPAVIPYSGEAAAQRLAAEKRVVYFFAANWCPTCKAAYEDLKASTMKAPMDLAIVVVDYDKEVELKTKYGVTYQHTFVAIGPMGEKRKAWSGSVKLADIAMETPKK
jgi:thiol-disulfide isomerase/thioredoxin